MPGRAEDNPHHLPEPNEIIRGLARELGLDVRKKPPLFEGPPEQQLFPEEAPTFDGRYLAGACLEEIYSIVLRHTPPGAPILLSKADVRWLHREFRQITEEAWDQLRQSGELPEQYPDFTLTHLLGATKRQIAHLTELKRFHETDTFDPAIRTYNTIGFVVERAILDGDPDPQYLGDDGETSS